MHETADIDVESAFAVIKWVALISDRNTKCVGYFKRGSIQNNINHLYFPIFREVMS